MKKPTLKLIQCDGKWYVEATDRQPAQVTVCPDCGHGFKEGVVVTVVLDKVTALNMIQFATSFIRAKCGSWFKRASKRE